VASDANENQPAANITIPITSAQSPGNHRRQDRRQAFILVKMR
jgi:hypothetical protein